MKVYEVDKKEFYKGYTLKYLLFFRKRLNLIERELKAGNLEQALVLTMDKPYVGYPEFNFYRINILIRLGHIDLALDVASDEKFKDFEPIQIQKAGLEEAIRIKNEEEERKRQKEAIIKQDNKQDNTNDNHVTKGDNLITRKELMTKLYVGVLTIEEIESANLPYFDKILFTICYYDKYNHADGLRYIKSIKDTITVDREKKAINNLRSRLENKRNNFFDIAFYNNYLCGVDFEYAFILERQKKEQERKLALETERQYETPATVEQEMIEGTHVLQSEEREVEPVQLEEEREAESVQSENEQKEVTPVSETQELKEIEVVRVKKNKKQKKPKADKTIVKIKDVFADEVEAIGSYVYVQANNLMSASSMKAFDIFENIVNQDINNKSALERFEVLVIKFSGDKRIGVSYNEEKFGKYLKKEKK